jgi:hypothetical protein
MNTRKVLLPALLVCTALLIASCSLTGGVPLGGGVPGSGNVLTESRDIGAFKVLSIEYPGAEINLQQGDKESLEIQADDNLLPQLSTEVVSGTLTIKNLETEWKTSVSPSSPVKIAITGKDVNEIVLSAPVGTLEASDLQSGTLKLVVSGGAQVKLIGIQVDFLDSVLSGAGDIQVSGTADEVKLILSGLGDFNAADLQSKKANIELSGMGGATVRVEEELIATITGAGTIQYYGHPQVEQYLNGAGSVKPAE